MRTAEDLIRSVKRRAMLPTSQVTFTDDDDILELADEELQSELVSLVLSVRQDFWTVFRDFPFPANDHTDLPIPSRAIGNKVRNITIMSGDQPYSELARRQIEELPSFNIGYYVMNDGVRVLSRYGPLGTSVRVYYFLRPGSPVLADRVARVVSVSDNSIDLDDVPAASGSNPGFTDGALYDVVSADAPYQTLVYDAVGTIVGDTITLSGGSLVDGTTMTGLPANGFALQQNIRPGDLVSLAGQTNVLQLPQELHVVLAQMVACRCLEALGDTEGLKNAQLKLRSAQHAAGILIGNRAESSPEAIVPIYAPARNWF